MGVALREVQRGRAEFGVEERGREHRIRVALREHGAGADEILELGMQADEFVAEALELDRGDLLEVIAGQKTQVGAAKFDGREFGGDEVADVAQQARLGREGGCRCAENGGEFGLGEAAAFLALRDLGVIESARRTQHPEQEHGGGRRPAGAG